MVGPSKSSLQAGLAASMILPMVLVCACSSGPEVSGNASQTGVVGPSGPEQSGSIGSADMASLLPPDDLLPGWEMVRKPDRYDTENLWDYVDGGAPLYLDYDFRDLITAEYSDGTSLSFVVDIYRMSSELNAFGVYSQARVGATHFLEIGDEAFASPSTLEFWSGPYYVRLISFGTQPEVLSILKAYATNVAARIGAPAYTPPELSVFPPGGRMLHSSEYIAKGALGVDALEGYFATTYVEGASTCKLFLRRDSDRSSLKADLTALAGKAQSVQEKDGYVLFDLPYEGRGFAFVEKNWAGIVTGNGTDEMKKALCLAAIMRLPD